MKITKRNLGEIKENKETTQQGQLSINKKPKDLNRSIVTRNGHSIK